MASSGAMADFARLPPQKKVAVFAVTGLLLGLLYWQFLYKPLKEKVAAAEGENQSKAQLNRKLADDIPKYAALKTKMKELTQVITENQKALPTEAEVPAFFETLERKVTESGVEIRRWAKLREEPIEAFVRVPVEIEITGTFMQIKRFFASLVQKGIAPMVNTSGQVEERDRIVAIDNLNLTSPTVKNREIHLNARFVAVTFRQEDGAAPAAAPAAKAAPPPPASAPPLPSAASPAGARARTENSIDKGDGVNRNATGVDEAKTPTDSKRLKGGI
ncbi:MAG: type 4a pilus biogenesis protein PilO [Deltaproteobacteria bacterium]|nr:type 4a pilus biogenesis protein PilO [Deltaproteobacteria bacterium]